MGGIEDTLDYRTDAEIVAREAQQHEREARARRRAKMTEHERQVEDVVDEFTAAVKDGTTSELFARIARDRVELDRLADAESHGANFSKTFRLAVQELNEELEKFLKVTSL